MNYEEALEYIHSSSKAFCKPGLERISHILEALSHPEKDTKFIHVAGTNGKGSTSLMLASVLEAAGYRVGLYTSPYVYRFNERMRVMGEPISDGALARLTARVAPIVAAMEDKPTEFEIITAIAFLYFKEKKCDVVVLEVGLGGRLDSTNVINSPLLSIITGISLDHTAFLGDTVKKIAYEKAGIIKSECPVIFGGEDADALAVIEGVASGRNSRLYLPDYSRLSINSLSLSGTDFSYKARENLHIALLGLYQPRNAALVLDALDILRTRGLTFSEDAVRQGLIRARWRARFEVIGENPTVIFDGAHNGEGIEAAVQSIKGYFGDQRVIVFTGVLKDKEYEKIARSISEVASHAFTVTPDNIRALSADEYAQVLNKYGVNATPCTSTEEAIALAMKCASTNKTALFSLGSLYTYKSVVDALKSVKSGGACADF